MSILNIKLLCCDVDGTLTDGKYSVTDDGHISKIFNTRDFAALWKLQQKEINVLILSGNNDDCILQQVNRMPERAKTALTVVIDVEDKKAYLEKTMKSMNIDYENVAYIGDAGNDLEAMKDVGFKCCPADAAQEVKDIVDYVSDLKGGEACVAEFVEEILKLMETESESQFDRICT